MQKLRVESFSISIDGFGAGPNQSLDNPLGIGGEDLHEWYVPTKTFQQSSGKDGGTTGVDNDFASRGFKNIGAWILGRNMFGPIRGPWPDEEWKGWWGENPPYHVPVFVLTHHERQPIEMEGGTTFYFVTDGIRAALDRAFDSAEGRDVRLGGENADILDNTPYLVETSSDKPIGRTMTVDFKLNGQTFTALYRGPRFNPNHRFSSLQIVRPKQN